MCVHVFAYVCNSSKVACGDTIVYVSVVVDAVVVAVVTLESTKPTVAASTTHTHTHTLAFLELGHMPVACVSLWLE